MEIKSENAINIYEMKSELEKIKKRDGELNFRANKADEYLKEFAHNKDAIKIVEKITKLNIPRIKDVHIHKIVDLMPNTLDDLKVILQGYTVTINQENMKQIIKVIGESVPKK